MGAMAEFLDRLESPEILAVYRDLDNVWSARAAALNQRLDKLAHRLEAHAPPARQRRQGVRLVRAPGVLALVVLDGVGLPALEQLVESEGLSADPPTSHPPTCRSPPTT